ncbi:MAG: site-specific DNA-methyltransferase [Acidobacteriota bacterium]|nr:site-specific DNA-methyltransferase [Acidobacteriota bacterium]
MEKMPLASVDLIYLDPPFKSDQNYNLVYKTMTGKPVPEQAQAFCDTWEMDAEKEKLARTMPVLMREKGVEDYYVEFWRLWVQALRHTQPHLMAYLIYMVQRLLYMKTLLRPTGSLYLHCDPTASHYIKIMMDGIFGHQNFRNEIVWKRTSAHSSAKRYGPVHDVLLFYTRSEKYTWNRTYTKYDAAYLKTRFKRGGERRWKDADLTGSGVRHGETGDVWRGFDVTAKGRHWAYPPAILEKMDADGQIYWPKKHGGWPREKVQLEDTSGIPLQDIWTDISPVNSQAIERLGYPTQKPLDLLKRLILSSSNKNDVVFDPFCGCGTTIYAAEETQRAWVGCDIAILAIKLIQEVLATRYKLTSGKHFTVDGIPVSVDQAEELFRRDPFQFQHWAVERVGGFPSQQKTGDKGIDGRLYFETRRDLKSMVLSVKGGGVRPTDVRDLRGVLEREDGAELAGLLTLHEPTRAMRDEAARAGVYDYEGNSYPRLQILTIREVLEDRRDFASPTKLGSRLPTGQVALPL